MIKISSELEKNAHYNPTKETVRKSIEDLCREVEDGEIIMPIFQRDLAWLLQKRISLLNFQLNGPAPVSPISMNKIGPMSLDMEHVELLSRNPVLAEGLRGKLSVIDGQQRISTNYEVYNNLASVENIVLNIGTGLFRDTKGKSVKNNEIPAGLLYNKNPDVYLEYIEEHPELAHFKVVSLLNQVRSKFFNYFYTVNYAKDLTGEEQIEWFNVLNLAGSRVPKIQMELTKLQVKGLDFYKAFANPFQEKLHHAGLGKLFVQKNTEISIPLATLNPAFEVLLEKEHTANYAPFASDAKEDIIVDFEIPQLQTCFDMTLSSLDKSIKFIKDNSLEVPSRIDYMTYLTGYFIYKDYSKVPVGVSEPNYRAITDKQKNQLINWYNDTDFVNQSNTARREFFTDLIAI